MIRSTGISFLIALCSFFQASALDAVVSHAIFYVPDVANAGHYVPELAAYWQINQRSVHYSTNSEKMIIGRIGTDIVLMADSGIIKHDRFVLQTVPRANADELTKNNIIDLRRYVLPAGTIRIKMTLTDLADPTNKFVYNDSFTVAPDKNKVFYSDVEFLDTTIESNAQTAFLKNGKQMLPACTNFFDASKKRLHYYLELYGTQNLEKTDFPLIQKVFIAKKETESSLDNVIITDTVAAPGMAVKSLAGSFKITGEGSGNYYLVMTLENSAHDIVATQTQLFQRLNPHPEVHVDTTVKKGETINDTAIERITLLDLRKTFLAKYDQAEIKSMLKMLLPFSDNAATRTIEGFLRKPDDLYMRYYIYNYFAAINKKDPGKAWKEFSEKILEVNRLFSTRTTRGYNTDRGFMYLRYGAPTEVVTVENERGALPYEIWQYNTLVQMNQRSMANAVILFYKPNDIGEFKVLHTNIVGERQNGAWKSYLYTNGNSNSDSRAEQFFSR